MFEELRPQHEPPPPASAFGDAVRRGRQLRFRRRAGLTGGSVLTAAAVTGFVLGVPFGGTGGSTVIPADPTGIASGQTCATQGNPTQHNSTQNTQNTQNKESTMSAPSGTAVRTAIAAAGLAALAGCATPVAHASSAGPTSSAATAASSAPSLSSATTPAAVGRTTGARTTGCAPTSGKIPAGAGRATADDVDHDGRADVVWLHDVGTVRTLGIHTASGATFSRTFNGAAPQQASAMNQRLADGSSIILLDTGRSVSLFAVVNCAIVPSLNKQGAQYTFDLGFTGYGTGVACLNVGKGLQLFGLDAREKGTKNSYEIYRTSISLSNSGRKAVNGTQTHTATGVTSSSAALQAAHTVTCSSAKSANEPLP